MTFPLAGDVPVLTAPCQMASGRIVDLANLTADDIHFPDIVEALSKIPRFNGATPHVTYTVAQHCCLMHDRADERHRAAALLADFHAAYLGEPTRPFLGLAAQLSGDPDIFMDHVREARDTVTAAIYAAARVPVELSDAALLDQLSYLSALDKTLTATEVRDLMATCRRPGHWRLPEPFPQSVKAWGPDKARGELIKRLGLIGVPVRG
ncbi:MAG: hypothetical protein JJ902_22645 [Roseibium sp.]|nr:hypothetical protein [Roseibium sp.]